MGIRSTLLVVFLSLPLFLFAQRDKASRFFLAKSYAEQGQYSLAMQILETLSEETDDNPYLEQSAYLYANVALRDSLFFQARQMLLKVVSKYDKWEHIDEARLLLSICYFHDKDPVKALDVGNNIKNTIIKREFKDVKNFYLSSYKSKNILRSLNELYPEDSVIAFNFAKRLSSDLETEQENILFESIMDIMSFDREVFNLSYPDQKVYKDTYNIAVLLPFKYPDVKSKIQYDKNKFAYEFYNGILDARDSLEKRGLYFNLRPYDTQGDTYVLRSLLKQNSMKQADLIIGPLYPELSEIAFEFANEHKIIAVNPLSQNEEIIADNNYTYLFQSTYQEMMRLNCQFALDSILGDSLSIDSLSKIVMIMDKSHQDTASATIVYNYLKSAGHSIDSIIFLERENPAQLYDIFNDSSTLNTFHCLFLTNNSRVIAGRVISALERVNSEIRVMAFSRWLDYDNVDLDQLERRHVYFSHPEYIDYTRRNNQYFIERHQFDPVPGFYARNGFEIMFHYGQILSEYGKYFQEDLENNGFRRGYLFYGIDYSKGHYNNHLPMMRVKENRLKKLGYRAAINYDYLENSDTTHQDSLIHPIIKKLPWTKDEENNEDESNEVNNTDALINEED